MNKLEKLDIILTQLLQNTENIKDVKTDVQVGRIKEYLNYVNNNPLNIRVYKNLDKYVKYLINFDLNQKFKLQYIHRIYKSPFYVSFLANDDIQLKILDFYSWHPGTSIIRLFIFKQVIAAKKKRSITAEFEYNNNCKKIINDQLEVNNIYFCFTSKTIIEANKNCLELTLDSDITGFAQIINFESKQNSSVTLDSIVDNFHSLSNVCKASHISNYFVTKNLQAEQELDQLWNQQKYILPDLIFDELTENTSEIEFWVKDFHNYFNIENDIKDQISSNTINTKSKYSAEKILEYLPSKNEIYQNYKGVNITEEKFIQSIQEWWNVYSLPLFKFIFEDKCLNEADEVFAVYFLSVKYKLPWAKILYEQLYNTIELFEKTPLHNFLFLLSFFYKRIIKLDDNRNKYFYSPSYHWDNNYKSLINDSNKQKYEITKFSKSNYVKFLINEDCVLKIDKLSVIGFDKKNKRLWLYPYVYYSNKKNIKLLKITIDDYKIDFPLIWNSGSMEFNDLKFKWTLKKNRFDFTFHSSKDKFIQINEISMNILKGEKGKFYLDLSRGLPKINLSLFNKMGGSTLSCIKKINNNFMISGFAANTYGILSQNILYSTNIKKHKLAFGDSSDINDTVQLNLSCTKVNFYIKHFSHSVDIPFINNPIVDKLLNLDFTLSKKLLLFVDNNFSNDIKVVIMFFDDNFGFIPEYYLIDNSINIDLYSNTSIKFKHVQKVNESEIFEFPDKNCLIINCSKVQYGLKNLSDLLVENLRNIPK